jgi:methionyl-tRNA formyltransferase
VTVHFAEPGIDTGDIVVQANVSVERGDTIESLRPKHQAAATALLLEAVDGIAAGHGERTPQAIGDGRQYYRMHPELRAVVERKLADGSYRWLDRAPDRASAAS